MKLEDTSLLKRIANNLGTTLSKKKNASPKATQKGRGNSSKPNQKPKRTGTIVPSDL